MTKFFTAQQKRQIVESITRAEHQTSGEIRVHIEDYCPGSSLDRAVFVFNQLRMSATKERNGILIFLAVDSRKFCVIGDTGINTLVPADFWDTVKDRMQSLFAQGKFTEGLCDGIALIGEKLQALFPYQKDDVDELPNDISFGGADNEA